MQVWIRKSVNGRMLMRVNQAMDSRAACANDFTEGGPWLSVEFTGSDGIGYRIRITADDMKMLNESAEYYSRTGKWMNKE
jgi:hypothetical protein